MKWTATTRRNANAAGEAVEARAGFRWMALTLLALSAWVQPLQSQGTNAFASTGGLIVADFNQDGIPDVLVPAAPGAAFTLSFGSVPYGSFAPLSRLVAYPAGCFAVVPGGVAVGDFNGDGYPDLAITCTGQPGSGIAYTVYVLLGVGDGTFHLSSSFFGLSSLVAGDFNHDGKLDLAAVGSSGDGVGQSLGIYLGKGDGTFAEPTIFSLSSTGYTAALAVDLNRDGYSDLVLGRFGGTEGLSVDLFTNNTDETFGQVSSGTASPTQSITVGAAPADVDQTILAGNYFGAGMTDLAVVDTGTNAGLLVLQNTSTGGSVSFAAPVLTASPGLVSAVSASVIGTASTVAVASDFVVSNGTTLSVLANKGDGTFSQSYAGLTTANSSGMYAAVDANGDGHADVYSATGTSTGTSLTVSLVSGSASAVSQPLSLTPGTVAVAGAWPGNLNFTGSTASGSQTVSAIAPVLSWTPPTAISFGTPLSAAQLDATATDPATGVILPGIFLYTPAAGTVLDAGTQMLSVVFTPQDAVTYTSAMLSVPLVVNPVAPTLQWVPAVASISYGTALGPQQLNATATGVGGVSVPGTYTYIPAAGAVLGASPQTLQVSFAPTSGDYSVATAMATVTVTQATPVITWAAPAGIAYGIPLSSAQLDATVTGVTGTALPGTLVYTPVAGTVLTPGSHTLSATFTPTDALDYQSASATVPLVVSGLTLGTITPNTATIGQTDTTIAIAGSGFVLTTMAQVNGAAVATAYVSPTALTAVIPAADLEQPGTLQITLLNPSTGSVSAALPFTVATPSALATVGAPPTTSPGTQPTVTFTLAQAYPVDLVATLTLQVTSSLASGVVDPAVQFAAGGTTLSVTIPAGQTSIPAVQIQAGTVASSITATAVLTANGVNVPGTVTPATIVVPPSVPSLRTVSLTRDGDQLTVTETGFSNTREIAAADFVFMPVAGVTLQASSFTAPVAPFATYFGDATSLPFGSTFVYTQVFTVSGGAGQIESVQVTLTNGVGVSVTSSSQ